MGNTYSQLTLNQRYQIQALLKRSLSARQIASDLGVSNSTISRDLKRCLAGDYCPEMANLDALEKRCLAAKNSKKTARILHLVEVLLRMGYSPEQISGRIKKERRKLRISLQTLYRWIDEHHLQEWLPRRGKAYRKRKASEAGASLIPGRVDIDKRPKVVDRRKQIGHWEADTVYGQDSYLVTLVERVSGLLLVRKVKDKRKETATKAMIKMLKPFKKLCRTITFDNGGEFAGHQDLAKKLNCKTYFAKPYHSWQRGTNENTNGLLRRYYPKGMELGKVSHAEIERVQLAINGRPRKRLNYQSPLEVLAGKRVSLIVGI